MRLDENYTVTHAHINIPILCHLKKGFKNIKRMGKLNCTDITDHGLTIY